MADGERVLIALGGNAMTGPDGRVREPQRLVPTIGDDTCPTPLTSTKCRWRA